MQMHNVNRFHLQMCKKKGVLKKMPSPKSQDEGLIEGCLIQQPTFVKRWKRQLKKALDITLLIFRLSGTAARV